MPVLACLNDSVSSLYDLLAHDDELEIKRKVRRCIVPVIVEVVLIVINIIIIIIMVIEVSSQECVQEAEICPLSAVWPKNR